MLTVAATWQLLDTAARRIRGGQEGDTAGKTGSAWSRCEGPCGESVPGRWIKTPATPRRLLEVRAWGEPRPDHRLVCRVAQLAKVRPVNSTGTAELASSTQHAKRPKGKSPQTTRQGTDAAGRSVAQPAAANRATLTAHVKLSFVAALAILIRNALFFHNHHARGWERCAKRTPLAFPWRIATRASIVWLFFSLCIPCCRADLLELKTGARLRGTWLNPSDPPPDVYEFSTLQGARLRIARTQVVKVQREKPAAMKHDLSAPRVEDTVDAHWKLAEWCRTHDLTQQRRAHLERILQLDPTHLAARRGLGFGQLNGEWVLPDDVRRQRGFVQHAGRWTLPQQVQLIEEREAIQRAARQWRQRIEQWRSELATERAADAYRELTAIRDPMAISGLASLLQTESDRRVRLLYITILEQIQDPRSLTILLAFALRDADQEVAHACLESLVRRRGPDLTPELVPLLRHADNRMVNRAAWILGELGSEAAIGPLVEALQTTHQPTLNNGNSNTTYQFARGDASSPASASFVASSGPQTQSVLLRNPAVLDALTKLTKGVSFSFDQRAWQRWFTLRDQQQGP